MNVIRVLLVVCLLTGSLFLRPTVAQETTPVKTIVIHPAKAPVPALRYELTPPSTDLLDGNAAVYYGKVFAEQDAITQDAVLWRNIRDWIELPLDEVLALPKAGSLASRSRGLFGMLRDAARCRHADWQIPIRDPNRRAYDVLLPEVQQTRRFARLLALRARCQIASGQIDDAIETLQSGYALAAHVSRGQTLVNGLVGFAIAEMMNDQLVELVQRPSCPNLYWAMAYLPDPLVHVRPGVQFEMIAFEGSYPSLDRVQEEGLNDDYWNTQLREFWADYLRDIDAELTSPLERDLSFTVLRGYPIAKRQLIAAGWDAEAIDAMPVSRVMLLHVADVSETQQHDVFKWMMLDEPGVLKSLNATFDEFEQAYLDGFQAFPSMFSGTNWRMGNKVSEMNLNRHLAALRIVEAIRMFGGKYGRNLPNDFEMITMVPIPDDPVTGEPFQYQRRGDTATLYAPANQGVAAIHYAIEFGEQP